MKVTLIIFALIAVSTAQWAPKTQNEIAGIRKECVAEYNLSEDLAERVKNFDFPDDELVRCYLRCMGLKCGVWDDERGFDAERLTEQFRGERNKDDLKPEIESCIDKNEQDSDKCTWAYRSIKCMTDKNLLMIAPIEN